MPEIQVDMFEVQLGAAMLLTFDSDGDTVRVLADAGVKASNYQPDHVLRKLRSLIEDDPLRLDLVIGTHYDEDHLVGLVPIINDETISIGEAWMPPVADDSAMYAVDTKLTRQDLLPVRFAQDGGAASLEEYLTFKQGEIETIREIEQLLLPGRFDREFAAKIAPSDFDDRLEYFRAQLDSGDDEDDCDHGVDEDLEPHPVVERIRINLMHGFYPYEFGYGDVRDALRSRSELGKIAPHIAMAQARSLATLRKKTAKEAINASALHDVVRALVNRRIPIRCEIIEDGEPRHFRWEPSTRRFLLATSPGSSLSFTLLGPSASLVQKHRDKLPAAESSKIALAFRGEIRSITPSNQLSYIGCFRYEGQSILVAGDAGCVDFKQDRKTYFPGLIAELNPLHVVQVAHHGGNNAHFYRVLSEAKFPEQAESSFLLLSHAYQDKTRPSDVFHDFLLSSLGEGEDIQLLFTSEPKREKVEDFLKAIHPRVGASGTVGDVQLQFANGLWEVTRHAIEFAA